jgi:hypothetical protein
MKIKQVFASLLSFAVSLLLSSCGDDHDHGKGKVHQHDPPHDGALIPCGDHQYNLEVVHDAETGDLEIYVLDGHASNPVRIKQESIEVTINADGKEAVFSLAAIADSQQEKTVGDTDYFRLKEALPGAKEFEGTIKGVTIKGTSYNNKSFSYPDEDHHHD